MKIIFAGTPSFAVPTLKALHAAGHEIAVVVTRPDRPRGRGMKIAAPEVKLAARELGLPVEQPERLRGEAGEKILETHRPDAVVIVAYGEIIPGDLLTIPTHGWINLHASLLPKYRGAAPVQWALIHGETVTGVTTMQIDEGMDTGPTLLAREVPIEPDDTTTTLAPRLASAGAQLMVETLAGLDSGDLAPQPQDDARATKAPLLKKHHGKIDWSKPAAEVHNLIRGVTPWPGAFTGFRGVRLRLLRGEPATAIYEELARHSGGVGSLCAIKMAGEQGLFASCGDATWLRILELQLAGKNRMGAAEFINGLHVNSGETMRSDDL